MVALSQSSLCVGDVCERNSVVYAYWGRDFEIFRFCNIEAGTKLLRE